jgi:hypothetical protein
MEAKGKISYKTSSGKAIKLEGADDFYNAYKAEDIAQYVVGQTVSITYELNKTYRNIKAISLITEAPAESKKEEPKTTQQSSEAKKDPVPQKTENDEPVYLCEDCGAKLKDNKYKKCYPCSKKGGFKGGFKGKSNNFYGSVEDIKGKETGCAISAAATVASGNVFSDPLAAKEYTLILAEAFLEWMRNKK